MKKIALIYFLLFLTACGETANYKGDQSYSDEVNIAVLHPEVPFISSNNSYASLPLTFEAIKEIKSGVYQGVAKELTENQQLSINFYTWFEDNGEIDIIDVVKYNDILMNSGLEIGYFYLNLWKEIKAFYLSYHDMELTREFLEAGKKGFMIGSKVPIGSTKDELITELGIPIVEDWYYGGLLYAYNEISYILDDSLKIAAITMPGNRISISLKEVALILGQPDEIHFSELDNTVFYKYKLGQYSLSFEAYDENENVFEIWLMNKK